MSVQLVWPSVGEPVLWLTDDEMAVVPGALSVDEADALCASVDHWFEDCSLPVPAGWRLEVVELDDVDLAELH